jgi:hypothetical protein
MKERSIGRRAKAFNLQITMKRNGGGSFEETYQNITVIGKAGENITLRVRE